MKTSTCPAAFLTWYIFSGMRELGSGADARAQIPLPDMLEAGDQLAVAESLAQRLLLMRAERG